MGIQTNPTNTNLAQGSKFQLFFDRLPDMTYWCTEANIPGVGVPPATQVNPNIDAPIPGDKMIYEDFDITFMIDEKLKSWGSVLDWIKGYSFPEHTDQYKNLTLQQRLQLNDKPQYSDATLVILSNKNNPLLSVRFNNMFPVRLSGINFSTKTSAEMVLTATAAFKFTNYKIERT